MYKLLCCTLQVLSFVLHLKGHDKVVVNRCHVLNLCPAVLITLVVQVSILMESLQALRVHHGLVHLDLLPSVLEV